MRILVTGGAGFIGSNFVRNLLKRKQKHDIVVIDSLRLETREKSLSDINREIELIKGSVLDSALLERIISQSDIAYHFAAESHVTKSLTKPSLFLETNISGTFTVCEAIRKNPNCKLVYISTADFYGDALQVPMDETHPIRPKTPYAASKAAADALCQSYYHSYGLDIVLIRPFNNYGPYQNTEKFIPRLITNALKDKELTITGSGHQTRDWVYVDDTCNALQKLLTMFPKGEIINLGTGKSTSVLDVAKLIVQILGKPPSLIHLTEDRPGDIKQHIGSNKKAFELLKWAPKVELLDGLKKTINWYSTNQSFWS